MHEDGSRRETGGQRGTQHKRRWSYEPCQTILFNQDGEIFYPDVELPGQSRFAVQGKEIKALHIFIFDNLDDWSRMEEEGMNSSAADQAVIVKEISLE